MVAIVSHDFTMALTSMVFMITMLCVIVIVIVHDHYGVCDAHRAFRDHCELDALYDYGGLYAPDACYDHDDLRDHDAVCDLQYQYGQTDQE